MVRELCGNHHLPAGRGSAEEWHWCLWFQSGRSRHFDADRIHNIGILRHNLWCRIPWDWKRSGGSLPFHLLGSDTPPADTVATLCADVTPVIVGVFRRDGRGEGHLVPDLQTGPGRVEANFCWGYAIRDFEYQVFSQFGASRGCGPDPAGTHFFGGDEPIGADGGYFSVAGLPDDVLCSICRLDGGGYVRESRQPAKALLQLRTMEVELDG